MFWCTLYKCQHGELADCQFHFTCNDLIQREQTKFGSNGLHEIHRCIMLEKKQQILRNRLRV